MQIVAKTTDGAMIQATDEEIREIIRSVSGNAPEKIVIGQKIPAIDYASSITKVKELRKSYDFTNIIRHHSSFSEELKKLEAALDSAASIQV